MTNPTTKPTQETRRVQTEVGVVVLVGEPSALDAAESQLQEFVDRLDEGADEDEDEDDQAERHEEQVCDWCATAAQDFGVEAELD